MDSDRSYSEDDIPNYGALPDFDPPMEPQPKPPPRRLPRGFKGRPHVMGRLDLRVGKVIHVIPDVNRPRDVFYFEYIQAHNRVSRAFVKGLNDDYSSEDLEALQVVVLYVALPGWRNYMESRVLGVLSARKDGRAELLKVPMDSDTGDKIRVEGLINVKPRPRPVVPFYADDEYLHNMVINDFRVNENKIATYKGIPLEVPHKGPIYTELLADCPVL